VPNCGAVQRLSLRGVIPRDLLARGTRSTSWRKQRAPNSFLPTPTPMNEWRCSRLRVLDSRLHGTALLRFRSTRRDVTGVLPRAQPSSLNMCITSAIVTSKDKTPRGHSQIQWFSITLIDFRLIFYSIVWAPIFLIQVGVGLLPNMEG
jgi:hypothetical protein